MKLVTASIVAQTCISAGMTEDDTAALLYDNGLVSSTVRAQETARAAGLSRRGFLKAAGVVAVGGLAPDPERSLWLPEHKRIFIDAPKKVS